MKKSWLWLLSTTLLLGACGGGGPRSNVRIELPLPPKLDLTDYNSIYLAGFISEAKVETFEADLEALNYFKRELVRRDIMDIVDQPPMELGDKDPRTFFEKEQPAFRALSLPDAEETLAVTGVMNFEVLDRSGFRQVQQTDISGRSYYRTQFVEITGFDLTMKVYVYDSQGRLLSTESLKDSVDVQGESIDERLVYYDLLQRISERVLGLFTNTVVKAERSLL